MPRTNADDALLDDAFDAFRTLILAAHTVRQDFARSLGLTVADTVALSHLAAAKSLSAGELAQRIGMAPSSITAMIDRLAGSGLVARTVPSGNRRSVDVALTDAGAAVLAVPGRWTREALRELDPERIAEATELLTSIGRALNRRPIPFIDAPSPG